MQRWLIDSYNLLISKEIGHGEGARDFLLSRAAQTFAARGDRVELVFDSRWAFATEREKVSPNVTAVYAAGSADDYIVRAVRESSTPRQITVVTDDLGIAARVREYRPRRIACAEFLEMIASVPESRPKPEKPSRDTPSQIERLLRLWGEE